MALRPKLRGLGSRGGGGGNPSIHASKRFPRRHSVVYSPFFDASFPEGRAPFDTRPHWGGGGGAGFPHHPSTPLSELGQIFFRAFGQSKILSGAN